MSQTNFASTASAPGSRLALIMLLLGGAAIGGSPIFVRLSEVGPMATAFWRIAIALLPLAILFYRSDAYRLARPQGYRDKAQLILPGFFLAADLIAWHQSIHITTVANATLLANLAPVFVTAIGWMLFGTKITPRFAIGLMLAMAGVVVLKGGVAGFSDGDQLGDALAIVAALFYAGYMLSIAALRSRFDTLRVMTWSSISAAIFLLPAMLLMEDQIVPATSYGWLILAGLALISHAGGQFAISYALAFLPASFSSLTLLVQPVVAALLGMFILAEWLSPLQVAGGVIVLCGIFYARRKA